MQRISRAFMRVGLVVILAGAGIVSAAATPSPPKPGATSPGPTTAGAELYSEITRKYLAAEWGTLAPDFAKTRDIAGMTKEQQADVAYMKQAVADGRPTWWEGVKQKKKMSLSTRLWQRTITTTFDPSMAVGNISMQQGNGQTLITLNWETADMDSPDQAEHGFTKGDLAYVGIWGALETASLYGSIPLQRLAALDEKGKIKLNRFFGFRSALAAAYYGTPRARRWAAFLSCDAYLGAHLNSEGFIPRRAFAVMLEEEIVSHPAKYPSIRMPRNQKAETIEGTLATNLMNQFERTTLTFAEDKALREAVKEFATANGTAIFEGGKVMLPSKIQMPLDPADDGDGATQRGTWLMEELAHPGIHAENATKPAGRSGTTRP